MSQYPGDNVQFLIYNIPQASAELRVHLLVWWATVIKSYIWHYSAGVSIQTRKKRKGKKHSPKGLNENRASRAASSVFFNKNRRGLLKWWRFRWRSWNYCCTDGQRSPPRLYMSCVDLWGVRSSQFRGLTLPWQPCRELWPIRQNL